MPAMVSLRLRDVARSSPTLAVGLPALGCDEDPEILTQPEHGVLG
jgi:hypothetical protein